VLFKKGEPGKLLEQLKEKLKQAKSEWNSEDNKERANKYLIGAGVYLAACLAVYELKKEREIVISVEEVLEAIKQSQCNQILVVKEQQTDKEKEEGEKEEGPLEPRDNFRKIFLKMEGVSYVSYVPEIQLFYQKLAQI
jgi:hypothetical protein